MRDPDGSHPHEKRHPPVWQRQTRDNQTSKSAPNKRHPSIHLGTVCSWARYLCFTAKAWGSTAVDLGSLRSWLPWTPWGPMQRRLVQVARNGTPSSISERGGEACVRCVRDEGWLWHGHSSIRTCTESTIVRRHHRQKEPWTEDTIDNMGIGPLLVSWPGLACLDWLPARLSRLVQSTAVRGSIDASLSLSRLASISPFLHNAALVHATTTRRHDRTLTPVCSASLQVHVCRPPCAAHAAVLCVSPQIRCQVSNGARAKRSVRSAEPTIQVSYS